MLSASKVLSQEEEIVIAIIEGNETTISFSCAIYGYVLQLTLLVVERKKIFESLRVLQNGQIKFSSRTERGGHFFELRKIREEIRESGSLPENVCKDFIKEFLRNINSADIFLKIVLLIKTAQRQ